MEGWSQLLADSELTILVAREGVGARTGCACRGVSSDPPSLDAEIDWLTSDEANAAYEFGSRLGTTPRTYLSIS